VYIPFRSFTESEDNFGRLVEFINLPPTPIDSQIRGIREPHLTLSKTVVLRHHWIESFKTSLQNALLKLSARVYLIFDKFEIYVNEERTRTFFGIKVQPTRPLLDLVKSCDFCLSEFNLEPYYKNPSFHISLAWMVGDQSTSETMANFAQSVSELWEKLCDDSSSECLIAQSIELKTGCDVYSFTLREN